LASALSKPRAYHTTLASTLARMAKEDASDVQDVRGQQWQGNRLIALVVGVAVVQIQQ
jgi:hypothetical protein